MVAMGIVWLVQPKRLVDLIDGWQGPSRFWFAVVFRLLIGIVFLLVAPGCRAPIVVLVFGWIAIVAAVIILVVGRERLDRFIAWWLARPPSVIRISALFAVVFGAVLIYAGPKIW